MAAPAKKGGAKAADHGHGHDDDHGGGHGGHDDHGGGGHCPPPWILTFADMATLLMAFFVIMLMTTKSDTPKFMAFAASMRQTFGRIPLDDTSSQMGGTSVLDLGFGPQSGEQTNDPPGTTPQSGDPEVEGTGQTEGQITTPGGMPGDEAEVAAGKALAAALGEAAASGGVTVENVDGEIRVSLPDNAAPETAKAVAEALAALADTTASDGSAGESGAGAAGEGGKGGSAEVRAELAAAKLGSLLGAEITSGAINVEQRDGRVFVTVGEGGAFASGSADLTPEAAELVRKLEMAADRAVGITVTGHTDNVPLGGSTYRDNWELASARAASVVREIQESGLVPNAKLVATSMGDTDPIADNATEEGRKKNRRVEIEIQFEDGTTASAGSLPSP